MTGTLTTRKRASGEFYYIKLSYKDPRTFSWKSKTLATHLEVKNNKRKAEAMIKAFIQEYSYLEELPSQYNAAINPDISLCDYLDIWLKDKERDLKLSTFEAYTYRINSIKKYFENTNPKLVDVTPKMLDTFFKYSLKYGKVNQKTKEREPLAVRSVCGYKSILYSVFAQASIDGLVKVNPVANVTVHGKKNRENHKRR